MDILVFNKEIYLAAMPVFILTIASIVTMLQSVYPSIGKPNQVYMVTIISLILAGGHAGKAFFQPATSYLGGSYMIGELASWGQLLVLGVGAGVAMLMRSTYIKDDFYRGEIAAIYLMVITGMVVLVSCNELISFFVGLELASIGIYALVGYTLPSRLSQEGAIKYFVLGAFSTGFLLFGLALLYAFSGTMVLTDIVAKMNSQITHPWVAVGALFTFIGIAFKLALIPFHMWAPDAYEGAPTGITAFMATAVKVMMIIVAVRILASGIQSMVKIWEPALYFCAALSMILGNLLALVQSSLKRMLAYSSIAHSGYMAIALCAIGASGEIPIDAVLFYLLSYCFISVGAFGVLMWLENRNLPNIHLDDLNGLANKHPSPALALSVFMFSLAGLPPTAGFMSKFFVFSAAISHQLMSLVIIGIIGSCISLYYYLRVIVRMYMQEETEGNAIEPGQIRSRLVILVVGICLCATIWMGTMPGMALHGIKQTTVALIPK